MEAAATVRMYAFADGFLKPEPRTGSDSPAMFKKAEMHRDRRSVLAEAT